MTVDEQATALPQVISAFIGIDILLIYTVATRPSLFWRLSLTLLVLSAIIHTCLTVKPEDVWQRFGLGSGLGTSFFVWVYLVLLTDPVKTVRHINDTTSVAELPIFKRTLWAWRYKSSARNIKYNNQVANIPPTPHITRLQFVLTRLALVCKHLLYQDLAQTYIYVNPLFRLQGDDGLSLSAQGVWLQAISVWSHCLLSYVSISLFYEILAIIHIALGISEPADWPRLFGKFHDAYTVRRLWGRTWHQMHRRWFTAIGKFFTSLLGFAPGTWQSSYTQLYVAFFCSGVMHAFGDAMVGTHDLFSHSIPFFLLQAMAITFEDGIIALGQHMGLEKSSKMTRCIGFVWTAAWFALSGPFFFDIGRGGVRVEKPPVSFALLKGIWDWLVAPFGVVISISWNMPPRHASLKL